MGGWIFFFFFLNKCFFNQRDGKSVHVQGLNKHGKTTAATARTKSSVSKTKLKATDPNETIDLQYKRPSDTLQAT